METTYTKEDLLTKKKAIREQYSCYKIGDIAVKLWENNISQETIDYILQGGEKIKMKPYSILQEFLDLVMTRMEEKIDYETAVRIRQDSACCLVGERNTIARSIYKSNSTIETRFEAFSKERRIIGGNAWKQDDNYYVTFWYAKPETGYTCGCLRTMPKKPMSKLWCECCAGHIKHHFETALGVKATSTCIDSVLTSCGEKPCLFKLQIISNKEQE